MELMLLAAYALLVFRAAFVSGKRTPGEFYVNNRKSNALGVGLSIIVSCVGASATIGMIGMAFAVGTPAFWWLGAGTAGLFLLSLALARTVRASGAYTLPHMTEAFLGPQVRPIISLVIVVAWSAILAAQFSALCQVLASLTGFSALVCLAMSFVLICGHSLGGQSAVMRADRLQAVIILLALCVMLGVLTLANPSWPDNFTLQIVNAEFSPKKLVYFLLVVGANYVVCPMLFGRMLSAKDERHAMLGGLIGACGIALYAALIVAVGLACRGLVPAGIAQDQVLTEMLANHMQPWMRLVVSFALISAIVSSADSCLVTAATVFSLDMLKRDDPACGRKCILVLGTAGAALSLWAKGILGFLLMAYDVFACGVVVPVFIGLILHRRRRINPHWFRIAVAVGGLLGLGAAATGDTLYSYLGMGAALVLGMCGAVQKLPVMHAAKHEEDMAI